MPIEPAETTRRPRYRYVLFRVTSAPLSRGQFVTALRRAGGAEVWLTRFEGRHGILRCPRGQEAAASRLLSEGLRRVGVDVETLSTSGTIAALERRYPALDLRGRN